MEGFYQDLRIYLGRVKLGSAYVVISFLPVYNDFKFFAYFRLAQFAGYFLLKCH